MLKAVFLDKDGIINVDDPYSVDTNTIKIVDFIGELVSYLVQVDYIPLIITNQSGIGRGLYSEMQFNECINYIRRYFLKFNVNIAKVYYSPFYRKGKKKYRSWKYEVCRKPNPGMLLKAAVHFGLSLEDSILIGDNISDIEAGYIAGVKTLYLVNNNENVSDFRAYKYNTVKELYFSFLRNSEVKHE